MRFPLADWIDAHPTCLHDLATSGMRGSVPPPRWPARSPPPGVVDELREELAEHLGVGSDRLFLAHGAAEADAWVLGHLARELGRGRTVRPKLRVRYPEYPPLFDAARLLGFRVEGGAEAAVGVAVVSRPRNPEGDLWSAETLERFAQGARHLLIDETFLEFSNARSIAHDGAPRRWTTGSFTKFFGADAARVGFAVAPPEQTERFGRYVGLVSDELAPASAAMALTLLRRLPSVRQEVGRVVARNLRAMRSMMPGRASPVAPLFFDARPGESGTALAERCLRASVLVCPGAMFGQADGVRICLTRRSFPAGLRAYLRVRDGRSRTAQRGARGSSRSTAPQPERLRAS